MYQLEKSISVLRDDVWHFSPVFKFKYNILQANIGYPDQTPRSAVAGLGLHYLLMSHKKDAMLIWVNSAVDIVYG